MTNNSKSVAALIIVLVVVLGLFLFYVSMCCKFWGLKHRVLKLLRLCLNCVTNTPDVETNQTPSQRIIQILSPWRRRTPVDLSANLSGASANKLNSSLRTPPPNYSTLKSPSPPAYSSTLDRISPKEACVIGSCSHWAIVVNEKDQTVKASRADSGRDNLCYENTEGSADTKGSTGSASDKDGSEYLELSRPIVPDDINKNKIGNSPSFASKLQKKRKQSVFSNEPPVITQDGNSKFYDKCESYKIIRTWSTPFSQCQPFQSEMDKVYAGNSVCHFVNTKVIVDGMKRDSVTRSFIVSPVKLDKSDDARLTSYKNIDNDTSYEQNNNDSQNTYSAEETYDNSRKKLSVIEVPTLLVTDPEDKLIYQSDSLRVDENFITSVPVVS